MRSVANASTLLGALDTVLGNTLPEVSKGLQFSLITSCSSTRIMQPLVRVGSLPSGLTMQGALDAWMSEMSKHPADITPREQYRGIGFTSLAKIQDQYTPNNIKIVTGGLGLTDLDEAIVPYDFTASPKEPENIYQKVTAEPFVQPVWWRMINTARGKGPNPVATFVESQGEDHYVIIACSKIFVRYIADDILSLPYNKRGKVRILLNASSIGSVPIQLRPMMIPFDRGFINDLPGNRNDNNHRAAHRFIELLSDADSGFRDMDISKQIQAISGGDAPQYKAATSVDLAAWLKERPTLLKMDAETAYLYARREQGAMGGRVQFRAIHRMLNGDSIKVSSDELAAADKALVGMSFLQTRASNNTTEDAVLRAVKAFVSAVKDIAPNAVFNSADVCTWAKRYFAAQDLRAPDDFNQPLRMSYIIKNNAELLGLQIDPTTKGYTIKPDEVDVDSDGDADDED
jgi:hypothetical protein